MRGILARHLPGAALALGIAFMGVLAVPASAARAADPVDFDLVATTSCGSNLAGLGSQVSVSVVVHAAYLRTGNALEMSTSPQGEAERDDVPPNVDGAVPSPEYRITYGLPGGPAQASTITLTLELAGAAEPITYARVTHSATVNVPRCDGRPAVTFVSYCFGDLGVHLSNGADAELAVGFSLISPDGRLVLAPLNPGETKDWTVQPPWANNFVVKIGLLPGTVFATGVWQAQGCSDPSPGTRLPPAPLDPPNSYRTVPPGPGPQVVASGTGNTAGHINPPAPAPGEASAPSVTGSAAATEQPTGSTGSAGPAELGAANGNGGGGTSGSGLALVVTGATATGLVGAGIGSALVIFVRRRRVRLADLNAPPELRRPRDVSLGDTPS